MSNGKSYFKLNVEGVRSLLKSRKMESLIDSYGDEIRGRAGNGYAHDTRMGKNRVYCNIYPEDIKAKVDNKRNNTLLKSVK